MFAGLARKLFGSANDRRVKSYRPRVDEINALEKELEKLSDDALRARTDEFKKQLADGKTLDDILVPMHNSFPTDSARGRALPRPTRSLARRGEYP